MELLRALTSGDGRSDTPFDAALLAGRAADRMAGVFAAAYDAAVRATFDATATGPVALCITEDGGNSPRAIETRFAAGRLHGTKSFVTFGERADELLVLASRGDSDGRKDLVIARVAPAEARVLETLRTPFMPEISHARVAFEGSAAVVIHDDAWTLVKSFRLIEDVYVLGATLAWLYGLAVEHGMAENASQLGPLILAARGVAGAPPQDPTTHLAYDGLHRAAHVVIDQFDWSGVDEDLAMRWVRDRPVLEIAGTVRAVRADLARQWFNRLSSE